MRRRCKDDDLTRRLSIVGIPFAASEANSRPKLPRKMVKYAVCNVAARVSKRIIKRNPYMGANTIERFYMDDHNYNGKTAVTFGVFDLLHFGHFELFRRIREMVGKEGRVCVLLQLDESIAKFKPGCKSVYNFTMRSEMISTLRTVDQVVPYDAVGVDAVKSVDFDILVCGPEHTNERFQSLFRWCEANGKDVVVLPRTQGISTTRLKEIIHDL